jgi:hypothetical protein
VAFANVEKDIHKIKCFNCQKMGHYANKFPSTTEPHNTVGATMLMLEEENSYGETAYKSASKLSFYQCRSKYMNPHWILLDSQSTADIFYNPNLLTHIHKYGKSINAHCNTGTSLLTQVEMLKNYGEVW